MKHNKIKISKKNNKKAFTLFEMIIVLMGFFILMTIVLQVYLKMIKLKHHVEAKQTLIQNSYYMFEKINIEIKDFTIDYEEYYNRKMVWCNGSDYGENFKRNMLSGTNLWYCNNFTSYWNKNSIDTQQNNERDQHKYYFCSSLETETSPDLVVDSSSTLWSGCFDVNYFHAPYIQSYWQYKHLFRDTKDDVDSITWLVNDWDDTELWIWPIAIADQINVQELYLISQDGTQRVFFRRKQIGSGFAIQILKLRWFDAGKNHDFSISSESETYDNVIDTRACDYAEGFECSGDPIDNTIYSGYKLPQDEEDWRVSVSELDLDVTSRNIKIYPIKQPELARAEDNMQINPYFTITITNKLSASVRASKLWTGSIEDFQLTLQTTFNTKNFYYK